MNPYYQEITYSPSLPEAVQTDYRDRKIPAIEIHLTHPLLDKPTAGETFTLGLTMSELWAEAEDLPVQLYKRSDTPAQITSVVQRITHRQEAMFAHVGACQVTATVQGPTQIHGELGRAEDGTPVDACISLYPDGTMTAAIAEWQEQTIIAGSRRTLHFLSEEALRVLYASLLEKLQETSAA